MRKDNSSGSNKELRVAFDKAYARVRLEFRGRAKGRELETLRYTFFRVFLPKIKEGKVVYSKAQVLKVFKKSAIRSHTKYEIVRRIFILLAEEGVGINLFGERGKPHISKGGVSSVFIFKGRKFVHTLLGELEYRHENSRVWNRESSGKIFSEIGKALKEGLGNYYYDHYKDSTFNKFYSLYLSTNSLKAFLLAVPGALEVLEELVERAAEEVFARFVGSVMPLIMPMVPIPGLPAGPRRKKKEEKTPDVMTSSGPSWKTSARVASRSRLSL